MQSAVEEKRYPCLTLLQQRFPPQSIMDSFRREFGCSIPQAQEKFHELLVKSVEFSPPSSWLKRLTKSVVDLIEMSGECCLDEIVEMAIKSSACDLEESISYHAIYQLDTLSMAIRRMRLHNEVGTKVWTAGMFLSELCMQNPLLFRGSNVLELGSGVGITGISLSLNRYPPKHIIMTDFGRDTMENLIYNVGINSTQVSSRDVQVVATELNWVQCTEIETVQSALAFDPALIDVILAADCIYSPDLCLQLTAAVESLLIYGSKSRQNQPQRQTFIDNNANMPPGIVSNFPFALIASTLRSPDTYAVFLKALKDSAMTCTDVTHWANEVTNYGKYFIPVLESHTDVVIIHCLQYISPY